MRYEDDEKLKKKLREAVHKNHKIDTTIATGPEQQIVFAPVC
jgi:hypothetical protein